MRRAIPIAKPILGSEEAEAIKEAALPVEPVSVPKEVKKVPSEVIAIPPTPKELPKALAYDDYMQQHPASTASDHESYITEGIGIINTSKEKKNSQ